MFGITEITEEMAIKSRRLPEYHVRLFWKNKKPQVEEHFYFHKYDGKEEALKAAKTFRDNALKEAKKKGIWPPDLTKTKPGKTNTSGTVGVRKTYQWSRINGRRYQTNIVTWVATWSINGKNYQTSFSEGRWGKEAFNMAFECRKAKKNLYPER